MFLPEVLPPNPPMVPLDLTILWHGTLHVTLQNDVAHAFVHDTDLRRIPTPKGLETYKTLVGWIREVVG